jgi:hypothetical protein
MAEELVPSSPLGQRHMNKKHKAKGGLPSKGWDQTGARIKRRGETTPKVIKSGIEGREERSILPFISTIPS